MTDSSTSEGLNDDDDKSLYKPRSSTSTESGYSEDEEQSDLNHNDALFTWAKEEESQAWIKEMEAFEKEEERCMQEGDNNLFFKLGEQRILRSQQEWH